MRYIRLLLADEDLANLLIMYLPSEVKEKPRESPTTPKSVNLNPKIKQSQLVQRIKIKHLKRRYEFRAAHLKRGMERSGMEWMGQSMSRAWDGTPTGKHLLPQWEQMLYCKRAMADLWKLENVL